MSSKRKIVFPTPEEDAAITTAATGAPDALPLTDEQLAQFKPMRQRGLIDAQAGAVGVVARCASPTRLCETTDNSQGENCTIDDVY